MNSPSCPPSSPPLTPPLGITSPPRTPPRASQPLPASQASPVLSAPHSEVHHHRSAELCEEQELAEEHSSRADDAHSEVRAEVDHEVRRHHPQATTRVAISADTYLANFLSLVDNSRDDAREAEEERRAAHRAALLREKQPVPYGACIECGIAIAAHPLPGCEDTSEATKHRCVCTSCLATMVSDCEEYPIFSQALSATRCPVCACGGTS